MSHSTDLPRTRVAVVLVEGDRVLLVRHTKKDKSYWLLPGGGLDYGEGIAECARREIREETGLEIQVERFLYLSEAIAPDRSRHILNITVLGRLAGGELTTPDEEVLDAVQWFPIVELPTLTLYPAIQPHLLASHAAGFVHEMRYLGSIWT
ncbi:MAG: hydrolase [Cyanobacteria bacterium RYN_339]|nr:hydrolase [Cyanobacteria bacterium RYN_339]